MQASLGIGRCRALASVRRHVRSSFLGTRSTSTDAEEAASTSAPSALAVPAPELRNAGPEPQPFAITKGWLGAVAASSLPTVLRAGSGLLCWGYSLDPAAQDDGAYGVIKYGGRKVAETSAVATLPRPAQPLELYEFESCPFCKKVREALSILDLDVIMRPCPKEGTQWRPAVVEKGGKAQFPFLVDPNTGTQMYESTEIIKYLFATYGPGADQVPFMLNAGQLTTITAGLGMAARSDKGHKARPAVQPEQPLVCWGSEASPFVKVVREVLCELQLPYLYVSAARGSPKRDVLLQKRGHFQVPYLEDPNTGIFMWESAAMVDYLNKTYGRPAS